MADDTKGGVEFSHAVPAIVEEVVAKPAEGAADAAAPAAEGAKAADAAPADEAKSDKAK